MSDVKPYQTGNSKKDEIREMFDNIAPHYDFLNHALSMNIDKRWRKKAIKILSTIQPKTILDVATGTGDLAISAMVLNPDHITGLDLAEGMLEVGRKKIKKLGLDDVISLVQGDCETLSYQDNSFDAVTVAFGVRNFEHPAKGLSEMFRVIKSGGMLMVIEFTLPKAFPLKQVYLLYFKHILPLIGKMISKDLSAYKYLPESVEAFAQREEFVAMMSCAGFKECKCLTLSMGIAALYYGKKND